MSTTPLPSPGEILSRSDIDKRYERKADVQSVFKYREYFTKPERQKERIEYLVAKAVHTEMARGFRGISPTLREAIRDRVENSVICPYFDMTRQKSKDFVEFLMRLWDIPLGSAGYRTTPGVVAGDMNRTIYKAITGTAWDTSEWISDAKQLIIADAMNQISHLVYHLKVVKVDLGGGDTSGQLLKTHFQYKTSTYPVFLSPKPLPRRAFMLERSNLTTHSKRIKRLYGKLFPIYSTYTFGLYGFCLRRGRGLSKRFFKMEMLYLGVIDPYLWPTLMAEHRVLPDVHPPDQVTKPKPWNNVQRTLDGMVGARRRVLPPPSTQPPQTTPQIPIQTVPISPIIIPLVVDDPMLDIGEKSTQLTEKDQIIAQFEQMIKDLQETLNLLKNDYVFIINMVKTVKLKIDQKEKIILDVQSLKARVGKVFGKPEFIQKKLKHEEFKKVKIFVDDWFLAHANFSNFIQLDFENKYNFWVDVFNWDIVKDENQLQGYRRALSGIKTKSVQNIQQDVNDMKTLYMKLRTLHDNIKDIKNVIDTQKLNVLNFNLGFDIFEKAMRIYYDVYQKLLDDKNGGIEFVYWIRDKLGYTENPQLSGFLPFEMVPVTINFEDPQYLKENVDRIVKKHQELGIYHDLWKALRVNPFQIKDSDTPSTTYDKYLKHVKKQLERITSDVKNWIKYMNSYGWVDLEEEEIQKLNDAWGKRFKPQEVAQLLNTFSRLQILTFDNVVVYMLKNKYSNIQSEKRRYDELRTTFQQIAEKVQTYLRYMVEMDDILHNDEDYDLKEIYMLSEEDLPLDFLLKPSNFQFTMEEIADGVTEWVAIQARRKKVKEKIAQEREESKDLEESAKKIAKIKHRLERYQTKQYTTSYANDIRDDMYSQIIRRLQNQLCIAEKKKKDQCQRRSVNRKELEIRLKQMQDNLGLRSEELVKYIDQLQDIEKDLISDQAKKECDDAIGEMENYQKQISGLDSKMHNFKDIVQTPNLTEDIVNGVQIEYDDFDTKFANKFRNFQQGYIEQIQNIDKEETFIDIEIPEFVAADAKFAENPDTGAISCIDEDQGHSLQKRRCDVIFTRWVNNELVLQDIEDRLCGFQTQFIGTLQFVPVKYQNAMFEFAVWRRQMNRTCMEGMSNKFWGNRTYTPTADKPYLSQLFDSGDPPELYKGVTPSPYGARREVRWERKRALEGLQEGFVYWDMLWMGTRLQSWLESKFSLDAAQKKGGSHPYEQHLRVYGQTLADFSNLIGQYLRVPKKDHPITGKWREALTHLTHLNEAQTHLPTILRKMYESMSSDDWRFTRGKNSFDNDFAELFVDNTLVMKVVVMICSIRYRGIVDKNNHLDAMKALWTNFDWAKNGVNGLSYHVERAGLDTADDKYEYVYKFCENVMKTLYPFCEYGTQPRPVYDYFAYMSTQTILKWFIRSVFEVMGWWEEPPPYVSPSELSDPMVTRDDGPTLESVQRELVETKNRVIELQRRIAGQTDAMHQCREFQAEHNQLVDDFNECKEKVQNLEIVLQQTKLDAKQWEELAVTAEKEKIDCQDCCEAKEQCQIAQDECQRVSREFGQKVEQLQRDLDACNTQIRDCLQQVSLKDVEINKMKLEAQEKDSKIIQITTEASNLELELNNLKNVLVQKNDEIATLNKRIDNNVEKIQDLQQFLKNCENELQIVTRERDSLKVVKSEDVNEQINLLNIKNQGLERVNKNLRDQLRELQIEHNQVEEKLVAMTVSRDQWKEERQFYYNKHKKLKDQTVPNLSNQISVLTSEKLQLTSELNQVKKEYKKNYDEVRKNVETWKVQLERSNNEGRKAQANFDAMVKKANTLRVNLQKHQLQYNKLNSLYINAQDSLQQEKKATENCLQQGKAAVRREKENTEKWKVQLEQCNNEGRKAQANFDAMVKKANTLRVNLQKHQFQYNKLNSLYINAQDSLQQEKKVTENCLQQGKVAVQQEKQYWKKTIQTLNVEGEKAKSAYLSMTKVAKKYKDDLQRLQLQYHKLNKVYIDLLQKSTQSKFEEPQAVVHPKTQFNTSARLYEDFKYTPSVSPGWNLQAHTRNIQTLTIADASSFFKLLPMRLSWNDARYIMTVSFGRRVPYSVEWWRHHLGTLAIFHASGGINNALERYRSFMENKLGGGVGSRVPKYRQFYKFKEWKLPYSLSQSTSLSTKAGKENLFTKRELNKLQEIVGKIARSITVYYTLVEKRMGTNSIPNELKESLRKIQSWAKKFASTYLGISGAFPYEAPPPTYYVFPLYRLHMTSLRKNLRRFWQQMFVTFSKINMNNRHFYQNLIVDLLGVNRMTGRSVTEFSSDQIVFVVALNNMKARRLWWTQSPSHIRDVFAFQTKYSRESTFKNEFSGRAPSFLVASSYIMGSGQDIRTPRGIPVSYPGEFDAVRSITNGHNFMVQWVLRRLGFYKFRSLGNRVYPRVEN